MNEINGKRTQKNLLKKKTKNFTSPKTLNAFWNDIIDFDYYQIYLNTNH